MPTDYLIKSFSSSADREYRDHESPRAHGETSQMYLHLDVGQPTHESTPNAYLTFIEERIKIYKIMPALRGRLAEKSKKERKEEKV
jgi:hypothetical protein